MTSNVKITDTFSVPGVGTVVNGTVISGIVHAGDTLLLGPDTNGNFVPTTVKSIQRKRINVPCTSAGQTATFALKKTKRAAIRKGMVILSKSLKPVAVFEFDAEILILFHSSTINKSYQTMMHCGSVRQTAKIVSIGERTVLRTGDRAIVRFRFLQHPEYLKIGTRLLFREGRTKGVGKIVGTIAKVDEIGGEKPTTYGQGKPRLTKEEQFYNRQQSRLMKEEQQYLPVTPAAGQPCANENALGSIFSVENDDSRSKEVHHNKNHGGHRTRKPKE